MTELLSAVFQSGAFHPSRPPQLNEGDHVEILIRPRRLLKPSTVAEELAAASDLPVEGTGDPLTSQSHDQALYGEAQSS